MASCMCLVSSMEDGRSFRTCQPLTAPMNKRKISKDFAQGEEFIPCGDYTDLGCFFQMPQSGSKLTICGIDFQRLAQRLSGLGDGAHRFLDITQQQPEMGFTGIEFCGSVRVPFGRAKVFLMK